MLGNIGDLFVKCMREFMYLLDLDGHENWSDPRPNQYN